MIAIPSVSLPVHDVDEAIPVAPWRQLASAGRGDQQNGHASVQPAPTPAGGQGRRQILVVDDYQDTLDLIAIALEYAGYAVLLAENGPSAIELAREYRPAAIIMDIYMPGVDGVTTTRAIRADAALAQIPVIAHTARPGTGWTEDLFDAVCPKPCGLDHLISLIEQVTGKDDPGAPAS